MKNCTITDRPIGLHPGWPKRLDEIQDINLLLSSSSQKTRGQLGPCRRSSFKNTLLSLAGLGGIQIEQATQAQLGLVSPNDYTDGTWQVIQESFCWSNF